MLYLGGDDYHPLQHTSYRNKIGIEEAGEILKNYLSRNNRNLPVLHRYAEKLGCGKILGTYLEVLL